MSSVNSCHFVGNLGKDPECRDTQGGDKVANFSIACTEKWKTRDGEKKERTTWVPVVVWGPLADICQRYLRKGSKVFICGKFSVRKYQDRDGSDRYSTEIVLQGPQAQLVMLDSANGGQGGDNRGERRRGYDDRDDRRGDKELYNSNKGGWQDNNGPDGSRGSSANNWGDGGFGDDLDDDIPFVTSAGIW